MRLDLLIPTYRRPHLVRNAVNSVVRADLPAAMSLCIVVINNDPDVSDLRSLCDLIAGSPVRIVVVHEPRPGKSNALNAAIAQSTADYLGFIDDDEEVEPSWLRRVKEELADPCIDFVGGRALPIWHDATPAWLPRQYPAVLGIVDNGAEPLPYDESFPGILSGGNAVIARSALMRVGQFSPWLGPRRGCRLFSCEDEDIYWRLVDAGARGRYLPDLIVHHHVHPERLQKSYYRDWCFWNGVSKAVLSRERPQLVRHLAGVPRYLYGRGLKGLTTLAAHTMLRRPPDRRFVAELAMWDLAGFFYGRHFYHTLNGARTAPPVYMPERAPSADVSVVA
jgi:cellulose synthase/poly-beta-1,6-N-acetylglucosamine synthase-like glycosyltransferase